MFLFKPQFYELLVLLFAAVLVIVGFTYLSLRRRDEILQEIFTPDEPELAREFFRRIEDQEVQLIQQPLYDENTPPEEIHVADDAEWGDIPT